MKPLVRNHKCIVPVMLTLLIVFGIFSIGDVQAQNAVKPRTVQLFYFLPNDRSYRQEVVDAMKTGILSVQTFFADQMEAHGYGRMTFSIETDGNGDPIVHRVNGNYPSSHYENRRWTSGEIGAAFDISSIVRLVVMDIQGSGGNGNASKQRGVAHVFGEWSKSTAEHELGHAFGLNHDFRDDSYVMSYGDYRNTLSAGAARFLSVNPYFNESIPLQAGAAPSVELLSSTTYPYGVVGHVAGNPGPTLHVPVTLRVRDPDGIQQVTLFIKTPERASLGYKPGFFEVIEYRNLSGETDVAVTFNYEGNTPSVGHTDLLKTLRHTVYVSAVDSQGNRIDHEHTPSWTLQATNVPKPKVPLSQRSPRVAESIYNVVRLFQDRSVSSYDHILQPHLDLITDMLLTSIPTGLFDSLSNVTYMQWWSRDLTTLPAGIFDNLTNLTVLGMAAASLSSLPAGVFDSLTNLTELSFYADQLSALPNGIFHNLTNLTDLDLGAQQWNSLPDGLFSGLSSLTSVYLSRNTLEPLPLTVSLKKVAGGEFKAVAPTGTPFDIVLPVSVTNGSISGGATTVRIPKGSVESQPLTVTRTAGTTAAVTVNIGTLPSSPAEHRGYALVKSTDLPLSVIKDINAAPVFTEGTSTTRTIAENTAANTNIGTPITATDADSGDTLTYALGGTDAAAFSIISTSGQLQTRAALDHETKNAYTVTVSASDGNGGTDSITVTINVTDVNETPANTAPVFSEGNSITITMALPPKGNTEADYDVGNPLSATDPDGDTVIFYSLSGTDAGLFNTYVFSKSVNGQRQSYVQLTTKGWSLHDANKSSFTVIVTASDRNGGSESITVTINVTHGTENNAPVFTDGTTITRSVAENTVSGQHIGTALSATDADNDTLTYTLSGTDAVAFDIDSTTGQLKTKAALDYETKNSYSLTITVSDGSLTDTIDVTCHNTDVNELPTPTAICKVGDVLAPGESCTYPGTDAVFSVLDDGSSQWNIPNFPLLNRVSVDGSISFTADINNENYHFVAKEVSNNAWEIKEIGDDTSQPVTPEVPETPVESDYDHIQGPWLWMIAPGGSIDIDNLSEASEGVITEPQLAQNGVNEGDHFDALQWTSGHLLPTTVCGIFLCSSDNVINVVREIGLTDRDQLSQYSAYALINIDSPRNQNDVLMGVGSDDSIKVWLNGSVVYENDVTRRTTGIQNRFPVNLNAGNNLLLIKVCNHSALVSNNDWGMFFKIYLDTENYTVSLPMGDGNSWKPVTPAEDTPAPTPDTRIAFEANTPAGYTRVTLNDTGSVWGIPTKYTAAPTSSDVSTVAYMVIAKLMGCNFADAEVARQSKVYIKTQSLGKLSNFTSEAVCGKTSSTWRSSWNAARITHLRFFDETSLPNVKEAVYNPATDQIELPGGWQPPSDTTNTAPVFADGASTTRTIAENTASGQHIGSAIAATDAEGNALTYTLSGNPDAAAFGIDSSTGQLKTKAALDYETKNSYTVTITVSDGSLTDTITVTINVTDINEKVGDDTNPPPDTLEQPGNVNNTSTIVASTETPLTEATLDRSVVTLTLTGRHFNSSRSTLRRTISTSGIDGITFDSIWRAELTKVNIRLEFNGDFDADTTLTFTVSADAIAEYDGPAFTAQPPVSGGHESVTASTEAPLTEETLDGSTVTLTLNGRNYTSSGSKIRSAVSVSGIPGVTVKPSSTHCFLLFFCSTTYYVWRENDTEVKITLAFEGDIDRDGTLTFTVGADAIAGYNGPDLTAQITVTAIRERNGLLANFPNPFNPETWIPYQLAKPAEVTITIYAINGQVVRRLALGHQPAGIYQNRSRAAYWNGRNEFGEPVASGLYFYTLSTKSTRDSVTTSDFTATRKMLIRK